MAREATLSIPRDPQSEPPDRSDKSTLAVSIATISTSFAALVGLGAKEIVEFDFQKFLQQSLQKPSQPVLILLSLQDLPKTLPQLISQNLKSLRHQDLLPMSFHDLYHEGVLWCLNLHQALPYSQNAHYPPGQATHEEAAVSEQSKIPGTAGAG